MLKNILVISDFGEGCDSDAILIGVYKSGELWTDVSGLGPVLADSFTSELSKLDVQLDIQKQWGFWRSGKSNFNLNTADPFEIANAVRSTLDSQKKHKG